jgi:predicted transcriptional regulator
MSTTIRTNSTVTEEKIIEVWSLLRNNKDANFKFRYEMINGLIATSRQLDKEVESIRLNVELTHLMHDLTDAILELIDEQPNMNTLKEVDIYMASSITKFFMKNIHKCSNEELESIREVMTRVDDGEDVAYSIMHQVFPKTFGAIDINVKVIDEKIA